MTVRPGSVEVAPGKTRDVVLATAALRSSNKPALSSWRLSYQTVPQIAPLLMKLQEHPELSIGADPDGRARLDGKSAAQRGGEIHAGRRRRSRAASIRTPFGWRPRKSSNALVLLRELRVKESFLTLTIDPQLKIEAMIDPAARPIAMSYYGIAPEREWEFWRNELLNGEPSTRHYALYGIARFYPDVALQMLPALGARNADESRLPPRRRAGAGRYRAQRSARDAPLAGPRVWREHASSGRAASGAADYLDYQLAQNAAARQCRRLPQLGRARLPRLRADAGGGDELVPVSWTRSNAAVRRMGCSASPVEILSSERRAAASLRRSSPAFPHGRRDLFRAEGDRAFRPRDRRGSFRRSAGSRRRPR